MKVYREIVDYATAASVTAKELDRKVKANMRHGGWKPYGYPSRKITSSGLRAHFQTMVKYQEVEVGYE